MLWMLKRTVSLRHLLLAPKHMFKLMSKEITSLHPLTHTTYGIPNINSG